MFKPECLRNEDMFVDSLNNSKVSELSQNLHYMIVHMFDHVKEDDLILCSHVPGFQKPDIKITINNVTKYVSLKYGNATFVHQEQFKTLIPFLLEAGVSKDNCDFILRYCYADGSKDGTGCEDYNFTEIKMLLSREITIFNREVNKNKELVKKIVDRCLFSGNERNEFHADYIYFGTVNYGCLCSKKQIMSFLERKSFSYMDNPHIGPLQFKPHFRGHSDDEVRESYRHVCDIWWARLGLDIEFISTRFNG